MKIAILLTSLLMQFWIAFGQNGIKFDTSFTSWNEVIQKAKKMDKPIFVDIYTTWCSPCKHMDRSTFPQPSVGKYYNENFLCVKLNAEKGYGIAFNKKKHIDGYPSFIFFEPTGETVLITSGFRNPAAFIALGHSAMKEYKSGNNFQTLENNIKVMESKIKSGEYNPTLLADLIKKLGHIRGKNTQIFEKYLSSLSADSLYSDATWKLVRNYYHGWVGSNSLVFSVLLHAYKQYPIRDMELMKPWWTINGRLLNNIELAITKKDSLGMEDIIKAYHKIDTEPDNFRMDKEYVSCDYFAGIGDSLDFIKYLKQYIKDNIINMKEGQQQQLELKHYSAALRFKFGVDNEKLLTSKEKWFSKSYISNYDLILIHLKSLRWEYTHALKKNHKYERIFSEAMEIALRNYEKYAPNYNESIIPFYAEKKP
jgi:thioredoxin-related protein